MFDWYIRLRDKMLNEPHMAWFSIAMWSVLVLVLAWGYANV